MLLDVWFHYSCSSAVQGSCWWPCIEQLTLLIAVTWVMEEDISHQAGDD